MLHFARSQKAIQPLLQASKVNRRMPIRVGRFFLSTLHKQLWPNDLENTSKATDGPKGNPATAGLRVGVLRSTDSLFMSTTVLQDALHINAELDCVPTFALH